jgi:polyhydroxybutyrate depolymerase
MINMPGLLFTLLCTITIAGCSKEDNNESGHRFYQSAIIDGRERTWLLNLPPNYNDTNSFPLVIALHGTGGQATQCENDYRLTQKANETGYVIVYPEGVRSDGILGIRTWNAGNCCDFAQRYNINDVQFISTLIDRLISQYKIDPKKVYVTGISNGAMLAYRLACEIPEKIAAIAPVSGTLITAQPCQPSRPMPILHIHSALDTKVPYAGGTGLAGYYFPPVDSALHVWQGNNQCNATPQVVTDNDGYKLTKWDNCFGNTSIECYLTKDGGHSWPGGLQSRQRADPPSTAIDANTLIWNFFARYQLP